MELENKKIEVSCDEKGDVGGFIYQTPCIATEVEPYPEEYKTAELFYNNIPRFYVKDGVVCRRTDEECEAYRPDLIKEVKDRELKARFEKETDSDMYKIIEQLAEKFQFDIPEVKKWLEDKAKIRKG